MSVRIAQVRHLCPLRAQGAFIALAGNHAGALALAARERGVKCYVVMVRRPRFSHPYIARQPTLLVSPA